MYTACISILNVTVIIILNVTVIISYNVLVTNLIQPRAYTCLFPHQSQRNHSESEMIGPRDLTDEVRDKRSIKLIGTRQLEVFPPSPPRWLATSIRLPTRFR